ncbi:hypothetical protein E2C01_066635 [Portunus trituberculatus]|uniref:Uncharacterized protein n=1 Tax=Portunus trituberculatus TaxID=210409 RepID=A0A5B7HM19_PORTR|nr:hypothetical protein [Portunus trituberculatus]
MALQTHCLLPESGQAYSRSRHHGSAPAVTSMDHPMHSDSHLLGGALLLSDRDDCQALFESPHPCCSGWRGLGAPLSPEPDSALLGSEAQDWPPQELEGGKGYESLPYSTFMYHCMKFYIASVLRMW